jgi:hypothetical protein
MDSYTKPQPVLWLGAITTGLAFIFGGLTTVAGLQGNATVAIIAGVGTLVTGGINIGKDYFLRGQVVPAVDTAAYRDGSGTIVTGPAARGSEGIPATVSVDSGETRYADSGTLPVAGGAVLNATDEAEPVSTLRPLTHVGDAVDPETGR